MQLKIKTLTPIWTGGVKRGRSERIHEAGILGSLRWWYEAIVRSIGGKVCDIIKNPCQLDEKKIQIPDSNTPAQWKTALNKAGLCDVCQLFGATGWKRRFKFSISDYYQLPIKKNIQLTSGHIKCPKKGRHRFGGWFFNADSKFCDEADLQFIDLFNYPDIEVLKIPLKLISDFGGFSQKSGAGYGVSEISEEHNPVQVSDGLIKLLPSGTYNSILEPDLREFVFFKVRFDLEEAPESWKDIKGIQEAWNGYSVNVCPKCDKNYSIEIDDFSESIQEIFNHKIIPLAPAVRRYFRDEISWNMKFKNYFLGTTSKICKSCYSEVARDRKDPQNKSFCYNERKSMQNSETYERMASKLKISHAYNIENDIWEFRLWGWLPYHDIQYSNGNRDLFIDKLIKFFVKDKIWDYMFNGYIPKHQVIDIQYLHDDPKTQDGMAYLNSLLDINLV